MNPSDNDRATTYFHHLLQQERDAMALHRTAMREVTAMRAAHNVERVRAMQASRPAITR